MDRHQNHYGATLIPPNENWLHHNKRNLKNEPVQLSEKQRILVKKSIELTCELRGWRLYVTNVRTNHVHSVVTAACHPSRILNALKANATRELRESGHWPGTGGPWADRGSKKFLWTEQDLIRAIDYVELGQGGKFPGLDDVG